MSLAPNPRNSTDDYVIPQNETAPFPYPICLSLEFFSYYFNYGQYRAFSFISNGGVTTLLVFIGVFGNVLLMNQAKKRHLFKHRLGSHLIALCSWDVLLLFSSFCSYSISTWTTGSVRFYGPTAYLIFIFHPLANISVTGTLWQMVAITGERYIAVTRVMKSSQKSKLAVKWVFLAIAVLSIAINSPIFVKERHLQPCYEVLVDRRNLAHGYVDQQHMRRTVQIVATGSAMYTFLCHFALDLVFRCPLPFVVVALQTYRILNGVKNRPDSIRARRSVRQNTNKANIPLMLTILNVKFLLCNTLFMLNTVMELVNLSTPKDKSGDAHWDYFVLTLYLSDISNLLLVVHSSTNWLLFYRFSHKRAAVVRRELVHKTEIIDASLSQRLAKLWRDARPETLGLDFIITLCENNPDLLPCFWSCEQPVTRDTLARCGGIKRQGKIIGEFFEYMVKYFNDRKVSQSFEVEDHLRNVGATHHKVHINMRSSDWHLAKTFLINRLLEGSSAATRQDRQAATKFASFTIQQIKSGYLCESVSSQPNSPATQSMSCKRTSEASFGPRGLGGGGGGGGRHQLRPTAAGARANGFRFSFPDARHPNIIHEH